MSDELVEVVGSVDDLKDGQYVDISLLVVKLRYCFLQGCIKGVCDNN